MQQNWWPLIDYGDPRLFFALLSPDLVHWIKENWMPPRRFVPLYPYHLLTMTDQLAFCHKGLHYKKHFNDDMTFYFRIYKENGELDGYIDVSSQKIQMQKFYCKTLLCQQHMTNSGYCGILEMNWNKYLVSWEMVEIKNNMAEGPETTGSITLRHWKQGYYHL